MDLTEYQKQAASTDQFTDRDRSLASSFWNLTEKVGALARLYDERDRLPTTPATFQTRCSELIGDALWYLANVARHLDLDLNDVASKNIERIEHRWGKKTHEPQLFDETFPEHEQLPRKNRFKIEETKPGTVRISIQTSNGRWHQLGARVTDNAHADDGYRYHDALHLGYMAVLGWSPVMRALLVCKRKSDARVDEVEDGARAINLEEALTAIVYEHAKATNFFSGAESVPFDLLKLIERVVRGLEVHQCTYELWSEAILAGYEVFRELRKNKGGFVDTDLTKRSVKYVPLEEGGA